MTPEQRIEWYRQAYRDGYGRKNTSRHVFTEALIRKHVPRETEVGIWVDIGCGRQRWDVLAACLGFWAYVGLDPAADEADLPFGFDDLPGTLGYRWLFPKLLVTCFDVLEHLPEEEIGPAVAKLRAIRSPDRSKLMISVGAHSAPWRGQETHETIRPPEWWAEKLGMTQIAEKDGCVFFLEEVGS